MSVQGWGGGDSVGRWEVQGRLVGRGKIGRLVYVVPPGAG